jgi:hypothetical protein
VFGPWPNKGPNGGGGLGVPVPGETCTGIPLSDALRLLSTWKDGSALWPMVSVLWVLPSTPRALFRDFVEVVRGQKWLSTDCLRYRAPGNCSEMIFVVGPAIVHTPFSKDSRWAKSLHVCRSPVTDGGLSPIPALLAAVTIRTLSVAHRNFLDWPCSWESLTDGHHRAEHGCCSTSLSALDSFRQAGADPGIRDCALRISRSSD